MINFVASRLTGDGAEGGKAGRHAPVSRPATIIATAGVALGLAVMILTICVSVGFKGEIRDTVRRTGGDLHVFNSGSIGGTPSPTLACGDSLMSAIGGIQGVESAMRVVTCTGCLKTDSAFVGVQLVGTDAAQLGDNEITLSEKQAARLGVGTGDKIMAYFFDNSIRARRFTVTGIYATHLDDFDATQVMANYRTVATLASLADDECHRIQLLLSEPVGRDDEGDDLALDILQQLRRLYPLTPTCQVSVATLEELHPQVFSWLGLLDINVWVVLALMLCVSGFTMCSGLLILILERTQMIGVLKALGARFATLRHIFLYIAITILLRGMILGNAIGLTLAWAQSHWHIVRLNPADYYVESVPIAFPWTWLALLNAGTALLTIAALIIPTYVIGHISPARAMRFD